MGIDLKKSEAIRGWMTVPELTWLATQAEKYSTIVEIGSYAGRSSRALGDHTKGLVVCIDDFQGADTERPLGPDGSKKLYAEFRKNLKDLLDSKKVVICHPSDISGLASLQPDFVFIDGDHTYDGVTADIKYWGSRLVSGGLLCGHDCNHPPIRQALQDHVQKINYAPQTSIWWATKD